MSMLEHDEYLENKFEQYQEEIGVEYEKISLSEEDGIIATKNLLLKAASEI